MNFLYVGLGGALGAISRYAISLIPVKTQFPILTLVTNIIGAIIIGFIVGVASSRKDISPNTLLFWKTGVCGGFTTFSTFFFRSFKSDRKQILLLWRIIYCSESVLLYSRCISGKENLSCLNYYCFWGKKS